MKSAYKNLTKQQVSVWVSKMDQILSQDLPTENRLLIEKLRTKVSEAYSLDNGEELKTIAIQIAQITPGEDFAQMFELITDYKYNGKFNGQNISQYLIDDLNTIGEVRKKSEIISLSSNTARICNCKWTCLLYGGGSSDCEPSDLGCGFLWSFECTEVT